MSFIPFVLGQHAEGAANLWFRRDRAVLQPHYRLADLAKLDGQLEGQLDGLRVAGQAGWAAAEHELRWREPGEVFSAAVLAFESGDEARIERVLVLGAASCELSRALVSALGWLPLDRAAVYIDRFLAAGSPSLRRVGIAAAAVCRHDPAEALAAAVEDSDAPLRARALLAVAELGRVDLQPATRAHLGEDSADCRFAAAWSTALLAGDAAAVSALQRIVEAGMHDAAAALQLGLRRLDPAEAKAWLLNLGPDHPASARRTAVGAGALGIADFAPWLIERMKTPLPARAAGEAFAMITGIDIADQNLDRPRPDDFQSGPTEDPADENVDMDPDENLPWPDPGKIAAWWHEHRAEFMPGTRYLCGRPISEDWLEHVLRHGYQRQRAAAALELAIRRPGTPLFEVRAPGFRQQELLG
jgi:uncharacterized protein (TIGR02270 family)